MKPLGKLHVLWETEGSRWIVDQFKTFWLVLSDFITLLTVKFHRRSCKKGLTTKKSCIWRFGAWICAAVSILTNSWRRSRILCLYRQVARRYNCYIFVDLFTIINQDCALCGKGSGVRRTTYSSLIHRLAAEKPILIEKFVIYMFFLVLFRSVNILLFRSVDHSLQDLFH